MFPSPVFRFRMKIVYSVYAFSYRCRSMHVGNSAAWNKYKSVECSTSDEYGCFTDVRNYSDYLWLKRRLIWSLADCNSAWNCSAKEKVFLYVGCDCFVSRYSTHSGEPLASKEVSVEVVHHKLLKLYRGNHLLRFSWSRECEDLYWKSYHGSV